MPSYAERQKAFRDRKRAERERREFEQFIINNPLSSSMTDVEKYEQFQSHRQTLKVKERKRKRAEAARDRRNKRKQESIIPDLEIGDNEVGFSEPVELNEEIRKRKRAEAARKKRKQIKLIQEQRAVEEQPEDFIVEPREISFLFIPLKTEKEELDLRMNECELLTNFDEIWNNAELLASTSVQTIQMPLCSFLIQLTSTDCINLIKYDIEKWSRINQPIEDRILLYYFITDYICCGLSSPVYHIQFNKELHSNTSKIKLLKELISIWNGLFKHYTITSLNVEFVKNLAVNMESQFVKLLKSVPENHIAFQCKTVINNIKHHIEIFENKILDTQVLQTLSNNNTELHTSNKKNVSGIENKVSYELKVHGLTNQNTKNMKHMALDNGKQKVKLDNQKSYLDNQLSKNPKLISNDVQDILNMSNKSDIIPPEHKLNVFQIMMLNAKKRKTNVK